MVVSNGALDAGARHEVGNGTGECEIGGEALLEKNDVGGRLLHPILFNGLVLKSPAGNCRRGVRLKLNRNNPYAELGIRDIFCSPE